MVFFSWHSAFNITERRAGVFNLFVLGAVFSLKAAKEKK